MQRLRAAEYGGHGLDSCADYIVIGILASQADTRGLAMRTQHQRLVRFRGKMILHQFGP